MKILRATIRLAYFCTLMCFWCLWRWANNRRKQARDIANACVHDHAINVATLAMHMSREENFNEDLYNDFVSEKNALNEALSDREKIYRLTNFDFIKRRKSWINSI